MKGNVMDACADHAWAAWHAAESERLVCSSLVGLQDASMCTVNKAFWHEMTQPKEQALQELQQVAGLLDLAGMQGTC